jgi:hypothetical protein
MANVSANYADVGTRFLVFPQPPYVPGYSRPEPVWISSSPDHIGLGPSDDRMYVVDPLLDKEPYEYPYLPPFSGHVRPPPARGFDGNYDQIDLNSRQFLAAHAFACARFTLDCWESYFGRRIPWQFSDSYERLEIIPLLEWENAQSGYGYLELGVDHAPDGTTSPHALNFDVIAHEMGHAILFSMMGVPADGTLDLDFRVLHEATADLVSLLSFMNFDTGLLRLLRHSRGNLLVMNELNRFAELSGERQIRLASNTRRMSEVGMDVHDRSRPFTGAVFDSLVERFHTRLVHEGLADESLLEIGVRNMDDQSLERISAAIGAKYQARPVLFKSMLTSARDEIALALASGLRGLDPEGLALSEAAEAIVDATSGGKRDLSRCLEENFVWRELL